MTAFLLEHQSARTLAEHAIVGVEWALVNTWALALGIALALGLLYGLRRRSLAKTVAALLVIGLLFAMPASARPASYAIGDYAEGADDVIQGTVTATETRWANEGTMIVTDVTIRIDEVVKGQLNKKSDLNIQLPTGRMGPVVRTSPDLPEFANGEEVLLFLDCRKDGTYQVYAGANGKLLVKQDEGFEYVTSQAPGGNYSLFKVAAELYPEQAAQAVAASPVLNRPVHLNVNDMKDFIRERAAKAQAERDALTSQPVVVPAVAEASAN
jgi:hypothetical protein